MSHSAANIKSTAATCRPTVRDWRAFLVTAKRFVIRRTCRRALHGIAKSLHMVIDRKCICLFY
jgi:hypothetical protein